MSMRMRTALAAGALLLGSPMLGHGAFAQAQRTEITFARFFGQLWIALLIQRRMNRRSFRPNLKTCF